MIHPGYQSLPITDIDITSESYLVSVVVVGEEEEAGPVDDFFF